MVELAVMVDHLHHGEGRLVAGGRKAVSERVPGVVGWPE